MILTLGGSINVCVVGKADLYSQGDGMFASNQEVVSQVTQSFYGKWKITKYLGCSYVSELSNEEAGERFRGKGKYRDYRSN